MAKKYGFGLVGCGVISKWHINAINMIEDASLIGVYDTYALGAQKLAQEYGVKAFSTYEEMLNCEEIDIINICTPSGTHAPLIIEAAKAHKNIIVEKPMAITKEQIDDVIDAVEKNNVKLAVISQLRYEEDVIKLKQAIDNKVFGDIISADVYMKYYRSQEYYDSSAWRGTWEMDGGGVLMNQGIHGIDLLKYLVGPVKNVMGMCKTLSRNIDVEDTANVLLEFKNGALGVIQGTTTLNGGLPRFIHINGTKGYCQLTEKKITKWNVDGKEYMTDNVVDDSSNSFSDPKGLSDDSHFNQINDFVSALKEDKKPNIDMYDAKETLDIILGAYKSNISGVKEKL